jgi:hypothetical protein
VVDPAVAPAAEAEVGAGPDDEHAVAVELEGCTVVDDDDLVRLAGDGVEAALERVAAVVRDDDRRDAQ